MLIVSDTLAYIRKIVSPYFLNMLLLLTNVLIGFYTHSYSIMFSAILAIGYSSYLYDADHANINIRVMDMIVLASITVPIFILWFDHGHPMRIYAGLIMLWGLFFVILDKLMNGPGQERELPILVLTHPIQTIQEPLKDIHSIVRYLGGYGHLMFNWEWALLVLL